MGETVRKLKTEQTKLQNIATNNINNNKMMWSENLKKEFSDSLGGGNRAAEKRESEGMGAESEWDKGTDGGTDCKEAITTELSFALYGRESMLE